jgi:hypothetical protein
MKAKTLVKILTNNEDGEPDPNKVQALYDLAVAGFLYNTVHDSKENRLAGKIADLCAARGATVPRDPTED